jgi:hypothetical protein
MDVISRSVMRPRIEAPSNAPKRKGVRMTLTPAALALPVGATLVIPGIVVVVIIVLIVLWLLF